MLNRILLFALAFVVVGCQTDRTIMTGKAPTAQVLAHNWGRTFHGDTGDFRVTEDVGSSGEFDVSKMVYWSVGKSGWFAMSPMQVFERAKAFKCLLGVEDGQYILRHQSELPAFVRTQHHLVLPGTVLRSSNGNGNLVGILQIVFDPDGDGRIDDHHIDVNISEKSLIPCIAH